MDFPNSNMHSTLVFYINTNEPSTTGSVPTSFMPHYRKDNYITVQTILATLRTIIMAKHISWKYTFSTVANTTTDHLKTTAFVLLNHSVQELVGFRCTPRTVFTNTHSRHTFYHVGPWIIVRRTKVRTRIMSMFHCTDHRVYMNCGKYKSFGHKPRINAPLRYLFQRI